MKLKLKGSVPFFTPKKLGAVFGLSLIICTVLRIYHVFSLIEPQTGFYSHTDITVPVFYAVLVFSWIFCLCGSFLSGEAIDVSAENVSGKKITGIITLLLSEGFFLDFFYCFSLSQQGTDNFGLTGEESPFAIMMRSGMMPRKAEMVLALLSCIYCFILAIMILTNKYKGQMKIFSLVTVFWGIARLVTLFVRQISFVRVSDLFLEIASTAFLTIFFFSLCECIGGVYRKDAIWRVFGVGLPAALTSLTVQIPRIAAKIADSTHSGESDYIPYLFNNDYIINYVQIFAGILIIAMFVSLMKNTVSQKDA